MAAELSLYSEVNLQAHIDDVLFGRAGPWPLSDSERKVLHMLRYRQGAANARPLAELASELQVQPRWVKALVKSLIEDFGLAIGATRQEPYGYFLCVTPGDIEDAIRPLVHEIVSLARRVRMLGGPERVAEMFGQLQLEK
jgi:hypothetical protein